MTNYVVFGLGFGDEGKGATVDALARRHPGSLVVRFNGGAQAAHNVVTPDGRHHTFSQFGSNMLADGSAETYLSRYMLLNPFNMLAEAERLSKVTHFEPLGLLKRVYIDNATPIITPYHIAANRARELARGNRHGSCGQGIGELASDLITHPEMVIRFRELIDRDALREKLEFWRVLKHEVVKSLGQDDQVFTDSKLIKTAMSTYHSFSGMVNRIPISIGGSWLKSRETVIFEGAQGVLLDEDYGFHPNTTWSRTTPINTWSAELIGATDKADYIGCMRTYMTRHGNGPLVTEGTYKTDEPHNGTGVFQGAFRWGAPDLVALRYAIKASAISERWLKLSLSHMDKVEQRLSGTMPVCVRYDTVDELPLTDTAGDLDYQESLRVLCESSKPIIEHWPVREFLDRLRDTLGVGYHSVTYGPTSDHRVYQGELQHA